MTINFESLTLARKPNQYLLAPDNLCANATPHRASPVYKCSTADLLQAFVAVAKAEPRVTVLEQGEATAELVQRSLICRFPDFISIAVFPLADNQSTLAIYSRSRYGRSDLGVNKRRIDAWLGKLDRALGVGDAH